HRVNWSSSDELGDLANAFNKMQRRQDIDEAKLRNAHKRLKLLYDNTPVMLYSVDSEDRIHKVSDYWLHATGYDAESVLGHKFNEFISPETRKHYQYRPSLDSIGAKETIETTCQFRKKDGLVIDVQLVESLDLDDEACERHSLSVMTDISNLKAAEAAIIKQAQTDVVTDLLNRDGFTNRLNSAINAADERSGIAVLFFDLDRFKWVNDNLGHFAGDRVLQSVASRVRSLLQDGDRFSRFGGDEFAIMLSDANVKERAVELANSIKQTTRKTCSRHPTSPCIGARMMAATAIASSTRSLARRRRGSLRSRRSFRTDLRRAGSRSTSNQLSTSKRKSSKDCFG
ncbi:MAG: diguanylate cyclase domain-containing protein, partial [Methyloligellaceae bacterium]